MTYRDHLKTYLYMELGVSHDDRPPPVILLRGQFPTRNRAMITEIQDDFAVVRWHDVNAPHDCTETGIPFRLLTVVDYINVPVAGS